MDMFIPWAPLFMLLLGVWYIRRHMMRIGFVSERRNNGIAAGWFLFTAASVWFTLDNVNYFSLHPSHDWWFCIGVIGWVILPYALRKYIERCYRGLIFRDTL